jgi:hypothetical protein
MSLSEKKILNNISGHCLCGDIHFTVTSMKNTLCACHCSTCRRWSGGPLLSVDCGQQVTFNKRENISVYQSSNWAERGFCSLCGTHLFYRYIPDDKYFMPIGLLSEQEDIYFDHQIFIDEKPHYYCFANQTIDMTGEEVVAQFLK